MILCHKCAGTFETVKGLNFCQCISGYSRGFEPELTFEQAATAQACQEIEWLSLYVSQNRKANDPNWGRAIERLKVAMASSPLFGHGQVDWKAIAGQ